MFIFENTPGLTDEKTAIARSMKTAFLASPKTWALASFFLLLAAISTMFYQIIYTTLVPASSIIFICCLVAFALSLISVGLNAWYLSDALNNGDRATNLDDTLKIQKSMILTKGFTDFSRICEVRYIRSSLNVCLASIGIAVSAISCGVFAFLTYSAHVHAAIFNPTTAYILLSVSGVVVLGFTIGMLFSLNVVASQDEVEGVLEADRNKLPRLLAETLIVENPELRPEILQMTQHALEGNMPQFPANL